MTGAGDANEFGYRDTSKPVMEPVSVQVAEGKHKDTLEPTVLLYFRWAPDQPDEDRDLVGLPPDLADHLADELHRWAARAREKHWE